MKKEYSLAASHAHRYLMCLASPREEARVPRKKTKYAIEGDLSHALLDLSLKKNTDPVEFIGQVILVNKKGLEGEITKEMARHVSQAYDYVMGVKESCRGDVQSEYPVGLNWLQPGLKGYLDVIIIDPVKNHMHIMDFKYGQGVLVDAEWNEQMCLYAASAAQALMHIYGPIEQVTLHIMQPRRDHYSAWGISLDLLGNWIKGVVMPTVERIKSGKDLAHNPSEKACKFCAAKPCRAMTNKALDSVIDGFAPVVPVTGSISGTIPMKATTELSTEELFSCLSAVGLIKTWCEAIKDKATEVLSMGLVDESCGYKLVQGATKRRWSDPDKVEKALARAGLSVTERREPMKVISPAKAEKLLGDKSKILEKYIVKPEGAPTIAPVSDKRESIQDKITHYFSPVVE